MSKKTNSQEVSACYMQYALIRDYKPESILMAIQEELELSDDQWRDVLVATEMRLEKLYGEGEIF